MNAAFMLLKRHERGIHAVLAGGPTCITCHGSLPRSRPHQRQTGQASRCLSPSPAAPSRAATVTGGVVALGDLGLHVIGGHIGLSALSGSVAFGAVAFFVVAAAGALWRAKPCRAIRWARSNPWRFAVLPALACAA